MDAKLAILTIEALEPYARRLVEQAERKGPEYEKKWFLALQQARLVLKAFDSGGEGGGVDGGGDADSLTPNYN